MTRSSQPREIPGPCPPNPLARALLDQLGRPAALSDASGRVVAMNAAFRRETQYGEASHPAITLVNGSLRDDAGQPLPLGVVTTGLIHPEGLLAPWRLVELASRNVSLPELAHRFSALAGGAALLQLELREQGGLLHRLGVEHIEAILNGLEARLLDTLPPGATLCRSRSERLMALFPWHHEAKELQRQAATWQAILSTPLAVGDRMVVPVLSLGLSRSPQDGQRFELLLESSYQALARAHNQPVPSACVAMPPGREQGQVRLLAHPLALAIDQDKLRLLYQPIVDMAAGRIEGVEVLCRWEDPVLGTISPSDFIAVAEATEQINPLGSWLIDQVFTQVRRWQSLPVGIRYASLNISPLQLHHEELVQALRNGLVRHGLQPSQVMLEITEDQTIETCSLARERLLTLHRLGFPLAMDDYGTGYSGLQRLSTLPFSAVKVDRSLIGSIETDRLQQAMVQGAVDLQNTAGLRVVVEGVERPGQRRMLLDLGCRLGQGFLFSRPVPAQRLEELLNLPSLPIRTT